VKGIFALLLAAPGMASATATINIKDTNYPIPSGAYFVSPDGKDTNSGKTPDSPWSVAKALASAPSGSTVVFRGGTYRNITASINKQLTLQAYPHEKPWVKGSVIVTDWVADRAIWRKDGWNYSFALNMGSEYIDPKYPMARYGDMVYINGVSLKQVASKAEVVPGTFYVDSASKQLYIGDNPAGKTVEATAIEDGLIIAPKFGSSTVIRGLGFAHYADSALNVQAPQVMVEDNTFVWNGVQGAGFTGADAIVRGNTFSYNGRKGVAGYLAHRMLLENNTISYNNVENFSKIWDAAGAKFVTTEGLTSRNNIIEYNFANGLWLDESSTNATIVKNRLRYNDNMGVLFEISHNAIIAANLMYNNGMAGIMVSDSSSVRVYNNTLSMNNKHIVFKDTTRVNTDAAARAAGIKWVTRDNVLKNNILSSARGSNLFDAAGCDPKQKGTKMIAATDYNAYYRESSSKQKNLTRWALGAGNCTPINYSSITSFKAATGFEMNTLAVDNVATNPFFVDEANGDYRLKANSPAVGSGIPLPPDIASAMDMAPGVSVDLGALQSQLLLAK
jgi:parallel beta-helix repeat protein